MASFAAYSASVGTPVPGPFLVALGGYDAYAASIATGPYLPLFLLQFLRAIVTSELAAQRPVPLDIARVMSAARPPSSASYDGESEPELLPHLRPAPTQHLRDFRVIGVCCRSEPAFGPA